MQPSEVTELLRPLRKAYYGSVRDIAQDVLAEFPLPPEGAEDENADARDDAIASHVDGTSWTIYTHSAAALLLVSDNEDAAEEMLGEDEAKECSVEQRAALAMLADVRELIESESLLAIAEEVAEHFAGTDAPLGIAARAAIAKAKGES